MACGAQNYGLNTSFGIHGNSYIVFSRRRGRKGDNQRHVTHRQRASTVHSKIRADGSSLINTEVGGCWVTAPGSGRPKGTVHFLGGAFAGASPQLIYPLLLQTLAEAGYTVISTPFAVTFKHLDCARAVHDKFNVCIEDLRASGQGFLVPDDRPIHGVGHSNGALLHLLIGCMFAPPNASNALISFNNKQVKDAIPLSLGPIQAAVANVRSQPWAAGVPSADSLITSAVGALSQSGLMLDERALRSIAPAIDQLNSVFNEVGDGNLDFIPTPAESRALIGSAYRVPYTLLIKFENDAIDETVDMSRILSSTNPAGTSSIVLPGTHVTPCGGDVSWQVGRTFSPVDALALGVKAVVQADIRRLGDRLIGWLESRS